MHTEGLPEVKNEDTSNGSILKETNHQLGKKKKRTKHALIVDDGGEEEREE